MMNEERIKEIASKYNTVEDLRKFVDKVYNATRTDLAFRPYKVSSCSSEYIYANFLDTKEGREIVRTIVDKHLDSIKQDLFREIDKLNRELEKM